MDISFLVSLFREKHKESNEKIHSDSIRMRLNFHIAEVMIEVWDSPLKPEVLKSLNCLETFPLNFADEEAVLKNFLFLSFSYGERRFLFWNMNRSLSRA